MVSAIIVFLILSIVFYTSEKPYSSSRSLNLHLVEYFLSREYFFRALSIALDAPCGELGVCRLPFVKGVDNFSFSARK